MKRCGLLLKLAMLVCVAITIVSAPPSSLAYIAANSNTVHNSFRVVYLPPQDISVPVKIQKSIANLSKKEIGPGGFDFDLLNVNTGEVTTATTSEDGRAVIYLPFAAEDVGKTYRYRLYELNTGREHVTYDETVYDISITLVLNDMHEISADIVMDGRPVTEIAAEFTNKYYVPVPLPDTGDPNHPVLWTAMLILSGAGLAIIGKKRRISGGCSE